MDGFTCSFNCVLLVLLIASPWETVIELKSENGEQNENAREVKLKAVKLPPLFQNWILDEEI